MRNEHQRAVIRLQILLQPVDGRKVQVVGRFVEEQQIWFRSEYAAQFRAHAPAAGKRPERLLEFVRCETKPPERNLDARLDVISAQMLELRLQLAVALHLRGILQVGLKLRHLGLHLGKTRNAAERILEQRLLRRIRLGILPRPADARIALDDELARVRRHLAKNNLKERRLAAPVRTHDAHAVALVDPKRDVRQNVLMSVVNRYPLKVQHVLPLCPITLPVSPRSRPHGPFAFRAQKRT